MNLDRIKNLSKDQKQKLLLAIMAGGGVIYAFWQFGLQPLQLEMANTEQKITAKEEQQRKEQLLLATQERTAKQYRQTRDEIGSAIEQHLPPYDNAMGWATEIIGAAAGSAGIQETDLAINERGSNKPVVRAVGNKPPLPLALEYRVKVDFFANYHKLGQFIAAIEGNNPYAHVGTLAVTSHSRGDTLGVDVSLEVIFLRFSPLAFPETAAPDAPRPVPPTAMPSKEG